MRRTITDAVHQSIRESKDDGVTVTDIAITCGVAEPTIYQWGETRSDGTPRQKIPACKVAAFCGATGRTYVYEAITQQVEMAMKRAAVSPVAQGTVVRRAADVLHELTAAVEDGEISELEWKLINDAQAKFVDALANVEAKRNTQFVRAGSIAAAESMDRR